jgi:NDP-sugar pyrophosphorylase family protein
MTAHRRSDCLVTVALYSVDNPTQCGIVELDSQSRVRRFVEKPAPDQVFSRLANAGIFVMEPEVLSTLPADRYLDFGTDIFPKMLSSDQTIVGHPITETLIDIGTPDNYKKAQKLAAKRASARIQDVGVIQPVLRRKALEG